MTNLTKSNLILSPIVVDMIRQNEDLRWKLANALHVNPSDILDWAEANSPHSKLTNVRAINVLQQETHIAQLLVEVPMDEEYVLPVREIRKRSRFL